MKKDGGEGSPFWILSFLMVSHFLGFPKFCPAATG